MKYPNIPVIFVAAAMTMPTLAFADDNEEPFDEGFLFFELNDTDGDLGIHGKIDGGPWKRMEIEGPDGPSERTLLKVRATGKLRRQGMTELFFESAEPKFESDDPEEETLDPQVFFKRFAEGEYEIEGLTLDDEELESEVYLSHVIPAAPDNVTVNDIDAPENCDEDLPVVADATEGVTIEWEAVTLSHRAKHKSTGPDPREIVLGTEGPIDVRYYEVVVEIDESDFKSTSIIPGDETEWEVPGDFFELADGENSMGEDCTAEDVAANDCYAEYKFEILVRTNVYDSAGMPVMLEIDGEEDNLPGNKSAIESCFLVPAEADED